MVEGIMKTLIMRTPNLRPCLKEIVRLALVAELVRQEGNTERKETRMRDALERFFHLCRERYAADERDTVCARNDSGSMASQCAPDFGGFLDSQELNLDLFGFDWDTNTLPSINL
jgi:hypothetical protein